MKEAIIKSLAHALEGHNSHLSARTVMEGLTTKTAGWTIPGLPYTIWQQIGHISFWQKRFIAHLKGRKLIGVPQLKDGWPYDKMPSDESELEETISTLLAGIDEVKRLLEQPDNLAYPPNYDSSYDVIAAMATHLSYHLGQIMILRRMQGDYPPPSGGYVW